MLKRDWDISIEPPSHVKRSSIGHFAGRETEWRFLSNEILRRNQGSIFISGYRGVGKTSLVYRALNEVQRSGGERKFLYVLLNAAQLEAESDDESKIVPKEIIINLIRRLYTSAEEAGLKGNVGDQIANLYRKAAAAEFKKSESFEVGLQVVEQTIRERTFRVGLPIIDLLIWGASLAAATALIFQPTFFDSFLSPQMQSLLEFLLVCPIPLAVRYTIKGTKLWKTRDAAKAEAKEFYSFDHGIGNLEFDLQKVHRELANDGRMVIYLVDELDKLDSKKVAEVLKFFKNFFTLSSATFIFVGGEEHFKQLTQPPSSHPGLYRAKEYTYFTSRYFISRPLWSDLDKFLDEIVENVKDLSTDDRELYDRLKRCMVFDSQGDFFDLLQAIKSRITTFEELSPIIDIKDLHESEMLRAKLQKVLSVVFADKYVTHALA